MTRTADGEGLKVLYADDRRYAPVRVLGEGHTARVLLATDPGGAQVAIKAMKADCSLSPREFMQEADRLQALRRKERELFPDRTDAQSGFPSVIDRDPEERFFVMEVAPGRPLSRIFSNRQIVRPEQAVSITVRVGEALQVAAALELRAQDLKSDAVFWDHVSGRVVIVDWNVVANARTPETGWLPADLRTTASYLDALLAGGETVSEWSGRIYDPPTRWNRYYRALRLSLEDLVRHPEGATLDEFLSTLLAVEAMLSDRPENLLDFVRNCLVDARSLDDDTRIGLSEQAAAAAEIALATQSLAVSMDGRALMAQAEDLAGAEGPLIARLWNAVKTADEAGGFDVGKSLETYRLRTLASVARRAPGYAGEALDIARQFARLKWSAAAKGIAALRTQLAEHPAVSSLLQDLEHEAKGLRDGRAALEAIEADDPEKGRSLLADGLAELSKVRYHDKLMERFPMLREQFSSLPAPAARKTEVDQSELAIQAARRRFARQGRLHLESFEQYGQHPGVKALSELQGAWDETDQHSTETPPRANLLIPPLLTAMAVSAQERGCFPLNRAEKTFDRVIEDMDIRLSTVDREGADQIRNEADAIGDRCRSITDALRDTDLDRGWTTEAVDALKTWRRRFRERAERASEAHQTLSLYVRGLEKLGGEAGLAGRAELLTRLVRRRPEDATVKRLMSDLRAELDDAEQSRPDDPDVIAARRVLDPDAIVAGASMSQAITTPNRVGGFEAAPGRPSRRPANDTGRRPPPRRTTPPARPVDRNRTLYIMGSAVLVVVILVAIWALTRPPAPTGPAAGAGGAVTAGMGADPGAAGEAAPEKATPEKATPEKATPEKATPEKATPDPGAAEKAAADKAAADAAAEKAAQEKAAQEKAAQEKAAREKAAREKAAREKAAREKAARDRQRTADRDDKPPRRRTRRARKPSSDEAAQQAALERARKLREQLEKERSGGGTKPKPKTTPKPKPKPKPKDDGKAGGDKQDGGKPSYLTDDW